MMTKMLEQFAIARQTSTPLVGIETPDPWATITTIKSVPVDDVQTGDAAPMIAWDVCNGWQSVNAVGEKVLLQLSAELKADIKSVTGNPVESLMLAPQLPETSILFIHNAPRYWTGNTEGPNGFVQAIANLRDQFKQDGRTLVLLGSSITLPPEVANDVFLLQEPRPDDAQLEGIVTDTLVSSDDAVAANLTCTPKIVDALRGLAAFSAEQVISMALELDEQDRAFINMKALWERKRQMIEQNRGLTVWREGQTFKDTRGIDGAVDFFRAYIAGDEPPALVVFIDELDKTGIVGGLGDTSGTANDQLGVILTQMQDNNWTGSILYGHPGTGKTLLAKTIGNEAGCPTIYFDMGEMQDKLVGESGRYTREAFKVVQAVGGQRVLFIATCNEFSPIKPELKRRFGLPTFFFDLMNKEARREAWRMYLKAYGFDEQYATTIPDKDWTGSEIQRCVDLAKKLRTTPDQVAQYIIPVAQSASDDIARRRREAHGKLLDAATGKVFQTTSGDESESNGQKGGRRLSIGGPRNAKLN
ncbi:MAG: hypothetical protein V7638_3882 [Acidobacteriota bacterium]|jgi:hypothetical protein